MCCFCKCHKDLRRRAETALVPHGRALERVLGNDYTDGDDALAECGRLHKNDPASAAHTMRSADRRAYDGGDRRAAIVLRCAAGEARLGARSLFDGRFARARERSVLRNARRGFVMRSMRW